MRHNTYNYVGWVDWHLIVSFANAIEKINSGSRQPFLYCNIWKYPKYVLFSLWDWSLLVWGGGIILEKYGQRKNLLWFEPHVLPHLKHKWHFWVRLIWAIVFIFFIWLLSALLSSLPQLYLISICLLFDNCPCKWATGEKTAFKMMEMKVIKWAENISLNN